MLRLRIKLPEACFLNNSVPDTWKLLRKAFGHLIHVKNSILSFITYCNQSLKSSSFMFIFYCSVLKDKDVDL